LEGRGDRDKPQSVVACFAGDEEHYLLVTRLENKLVVS
jgi:hypothetical protein